MTKAEFRLYDRVVYVGPAGRLESVHHGDVGFIIEMHGDDAFEVEFCRKDGSTYAQEVISPRLLQPAPTS